MGCIGWRKKGRRRKRRRRRRRRRRGCVMCAAVIPQCKKQCKKCRIIKRTCHKCQRAVCESVSGPSSQCKKCVRKPGFIYGFQGEGCVRSSSRIRLHGSACRHYTPAMVKYNKMPKKYVGYAHAAACCDSVEKRGRRRRRRWRRRRRRRRRAKDVDAKDVDAKDVDAGGLTTGDITSMNYSGQT